MKNHISIIALSVALAVSGCSSQMKVLTGEAGAELQSKGKTELEEAYKSEPQQNELDNIVEVEDFYVPQLTLNQQNRPAWFFDQVNTQFSSITLVEYMALLQKKKKINARYLDGLDKNITFSIYNTDKIGAALEKIKLATGFNYSIEDNVVTWSQFETAAIDISFIPGLSSYRIGGQNNGGSSSSAQDRFGTSSSIDMVVSESGVEDDDNYVNIEAREIDNVADLTSVVNLYKSDKGRFHIQNTTSTLYVSDLPENIKKIREAIEKENKKITAMVYLDIRIIDYIDSSGTERGLNWSAIADDLVGSGTIDYATNFSASLLDGAASTFTFTQDGGKMDGSQAIINALDEQGVTYYSIQPKVNLRNNRPSKVIDGDDYTYLASSGSSSTTTSSSDILIPGVLTTGLNLYAVANINLDNGMIVGTISNKFASLTEMGTVTSDSSTIQTPESKRKAFHQEFSVKDGDTIMLSGLIQQRSEYSSSVAGSLLAGGNNGVSEEYTNTIILITPHIRRY